MPHRTAARRRLPALAIALCLGCAAPPRVAVERLEGTDLAQQQRFAVRPELAPADDPAFGPAARKAARDALIEALRGRGLEQVEDPGAADLLVAVGVTTRTHREGGDAIPTGPHVHTERSGVRTPLGDVPLHERRVVHPGSGFATPAHEVRSRTVVVDLYEADSQRLVWRGSSRDPRSPRRIDLDDLRERVRAIVAELR